MHVRDATAEDADAGVSRLKRSIAELCASDYHNDPAILAQWLGNKTVENFVRWINQPDNSLLVAVDEGRVLAVGSVTDSGHSD